MAVIEIEIHIIRSLEGESLRNDSELSISGQHFLEPVFAGMVIVCAGYRITVGIGKSVKLRRIEMNRVSIGVALVIDVIYRRIKEGLLASV